MKSYSIGGPSATTRMVARMGGRGLLLASLVTGGVCMGAPKSIVEFAPKDAVFVAGANDYAALRATIDSCGLGELMKEPEVQQWFGDLTKEFADDLTSRLEEMGIDKEQLKEPKGMLGVTGWFGPDATDEDPDFRVVWAIDFGENAEAMNTLVVEALEKAEGDDKITIEEDEYEGVKVYSFTEIEGADDGEDADDEFEDFDDFGGGMGGPFDPGMIADQIEDVLVAASYARVGNFLLMGSDAESLEQAIDVASGKAMDETIEDADGFSTSMNMVGQSQSFGALMISTLWEKGMEQAEAMPEAAQPMQMMKALGLHHVKAVAFGASFDTDSGAMEQTLGVAVPEVTGLMKLMAPAAKPLAIPSIFSAASASVTMLQFDFAGLIPVVNQVLATMPEEERGFIQEQVDAAATAVGPVLAQLGPELYLGQSYARPFAADSQRMILAVKVKEAQPVIDFVANMVAPNIGLEARDFQGNQVWSTPEGGMGMIPIPGGVSASVAGGYLLLGQTAEVETAIQTSSGDAASRLSESPAAKAAMASVEANGLGFTYTSLSETVEYTDWMTSNWEKMIEQQVSIAFEGWGDDPDMAAMKEDAIKEAKESYPEFMKNMPSLKLMTKFFGDTVGDFQKTDEGWVLKFVTLRAAK